MNADQLAKMTPEEKRIAIGKICGHDWYLMPGDRMRIFAKNGNLNHNFPDQSPTSEDLPVWDMDCPDYLNSLDACQIFQTILEEKILMGEYELMLARVVHGMRLDTHLHWSDLGNYNLTFSSALHRSDAFLLVMLPD